MSSSALTELLDGRRSRRSRHLHRRSLHRTGRSTCRWLPALHRTTCLPHELLDGLRTPPHSRTEAHISGTCLRKLPARAVACQCAGLGSAAKGLHRSVGGLHHTGEFLLPEKCSARSKLCTTEIRRSREHSKPYSGRWSRTGCGPLRLRFREVLLLGVSGRECR
jgi:hypothetical protein